MKTKVVVATNNKGKLAEILDVMGASEFELIAQADLHISEAEETGTTFVENAIIKARHAASASGLPALADDSGLLVDALNGAPGLISAHYAGVHGDSAGNIAKLLLALEGVPRENRRAKFFSVIVFLLSADDPAPFVCQGEWQGEILFAPEGEGGFGYDPIFYSPEYHCSAANLSGEIKNRISHRGRALLAFQNALQLRRQNNLDTNRLQLFRPIARQNAAHYEWGKQCHGWHLLERADLHVIEEQVPVGEAEIEHRHVRARQCFYILRGRAQIDVEGVLHQLNTGDTLYIAPMQRHRFINSGDVAVEFLVISNPSTRGDRINTADKIEP